MKAIIGTLIVGASLGLTSLPAAAGHNDGDHHHFKKEIYEQSERIEDGIARGELTRREARKLQKQNRRIRHLAREFREDGWVSRRERHILKHRLIDASKDIYRLKHNDRVCYHPYERSDHRPFHKRHSYRT